MSTAEHDVVAEHESVRRTFELSKQLFGEEPTFAPEFDLGKVNLETRIQLRYDRTTAPKEMVDRYVWQMGESRLPPIVVTRDGVIVDGNTRAHARRQREERFVAAVVLPVNGEDADTETQERLMFLGQALNSVN